jgi:hypothetical protein
MATRLRRFCVCACYVLWALGPLFTEGIAATYITSKVIRQSRSTARAIRNHRLLLYAVRSFAFFPYFDILIFK